VGVSNAVAGLIKGVETPALQPLSSTARGGKKRKKNWLVALEFCGSGARAGREKTSRRLSVPLGRGRWAAWWTSNRAAGHKAKMGGELLPHGLVKKKRSSE